MSRAAASVAVHLPLTCGPDSAIRGFCPRRKPPVGRRSCIRVNETIFVKYVFYGLKYYQPFMEKLGSGSTNQTELSAKAVRMLLFPLPPLAEQKRIVARLEELLPLCEKLK